MTDSLEFSPKEEFIHRISKLNSSSAPDITLSELYHVQDDSDHTIDPRAFPFYDSDVPFLREYQELKDFCLRYLESSFNKDKLHYFVQEILSILQKKLFSLFLLRDENDLEHLAISKVLNEMFLRKYNLLQEIWDIFVEWIWNISKKDFKIKHVLLHFIFNFVAKMYSMDWREVKSSSIEEENDEQTLAEDECKDSMNIGQAPFQIHEKQSQSYQFMKLLQSKERKSLIQRVLCFLRQDFDITLVDLLVYKEQYEVWTQAKEDFHVGMYEDLTEEQMEDYDMNDTSFLLPLQFQYAWNAYGIGCLFFTLFVEKIYGDFFVVEGLFQPYYYFRQCSGYIVDLIGSQTAQLGFIGLHLSMNLLKQIPMSSLVIDDKDKYSSLQFHFKFVTSLVNFMASCPEHEPRTKTYQVLNDYIYKFNDHGRMEILQATISECPFPSLLGLLLSRLKDEICKEYNAILVRIGHPLEEYKLSLSSQSELQQQDGQSRTLPPIVKMRKETIEQLHLRRENIVYVTSQSLSLVCNSISKFISDLSEDSVDVILHGLNTYYFILLRDCDPNLTKVRSKESIKEWREKVLEPLKISIKKVENHMNEIYAILRKKQEQSEQMDTDHIMENMDESCESSEDLSESILDLDEEEIEELYQELTEEEMYIVKQDREKKIQKRKLEESDFAELPSHSRIQYEMRVLMLKDLISRIESVLQFFEENYKEARDKKQ